MRSRFQSSPMSRHERCALGFLASFLTRLLETQVSLLLLSFARPR
jgi:hypothetical protein